MSFLKLELLIYLSPFFTATTGLKATSIHTCSHSYNRIFSILRTAQKEVGVSKLIALYMFVLDLILLLIIVTDFVYIMVSSVGFGQIASQFIVRPLPSFQITKIMVRF